MFGLADWLEPAHSSFAISPNHLRQPGKRRSLSRQPLVEYIMRYYADSAMSLSTMAEAFAMSERSLSRYFKERMDDTFSALLEKKRLSEAENLLRQGKHTMKVKLVTVRLCQHNHVSKGLQAPPRNHPVRMAGPGEIRRKRSRALRDARNRRVEGAMNKGAPQAAKRNHKDRRAAKSGMARWFLYHILYIHFVAGENALAGIDKCRREIV